jgi:hypothetical protein
MAHHVDRVVWQGVEYLTENIDVFAEAEKRRTQGPDATSDVVEVYRKELADLDAEQASIRDARPRLKDPRIREHLIEKSNKLAERRPSIEKALAVAEAELGEENNQLARLEEMKLWVHAWKEHQAQMDYESKRLMLRILGIRVTIYDPGHTPRVEIRTRSQFRDFFVTAPIFSRPEEPDGYTFAPESCVMNI